MNRRLGARDESNRPEGKFVRCEKLTRGCLNVARITAEFPGSVETLSLIQEFFFDADLRLRRHDYSVNVAGGFPAAQLTSDYVVADGIHLPPRRRAYTRGPMSALRSMGLFVWALVKLWLFRTLSKATKQKPMLR